MHVRHEEAEARRTVDRLEALTEEAVDWVMAELYRRYTKELSLFGARGRLHTRQDLRYHMEFLTAAVALSSPAYFQDYVRWVAAVLKARGVPIQTLAESLSLLKEFLSSRIQPSLFSPVAEVCDAGAGTLVLAVELPVPLYHGHLPLADLETPVLTERLIAGDTRGAEAIVSRVQARGAGYLYTATHLIQPALYAIGLGWQENRFTVASRKKAVYRYRSSEVSVAHTGSLNSENP